MTAHKPQARVAHSRFRGIHEVDGVPTTHEQHGWVHAWTVTDRPGNAPPFPFAAKPPIPATAAVTVMCTTVLSAFLVALLVILDGHPNRPLIVVLCCAGLAVFMAVLVLPALVEESSWMTPWERSTRNGRNCFGLPWTP